MFFFVDNLKNGKFHQHLRDIFAPQVKKLQKNRAWQTTQLWRQRDNWGGNLPQFSGQRKCCLSEILCRLFTLLRCANICHTLACPMEALIFVSRCCNLNCRKPSSENNYKMWVIYCGQVYLFNPGLLHFDGAVYGPDGVQCCPVHIF